MKPSDNLYRIDLSYFGRDFLGWQSQPGGNTVQDHLESALSTAMREPIKIMGASRTDTGVHAEMQVATFGTNQEVDIFKLMASLHGILPQTIGVQAIQKVENDFHPIASCSGKIYRYRFWCDYRRNPFVNDFCWTVGPLAEPDQMKDSASQLIGKHDFTSFCAVDSSAKTMVREIFDIRFYHHGPLLELWIHGSGFLKQMVRTIAGTLVEVGRGKREQHEIHDILQARDRRVAGQTAPAHGLTLVNVLYGEPWLTIAHEMERARAGFGTSLESWRDRQ